jgi:hypothetical protein
MVVDLGRRPSSIFGEEFLSAPIHSPPLWSPSRSFNRIPAEVDWEMSSLLWVLILEGRKLETRTLASGTSSILHVIGQFWSKNSTSYPNMGEYKGSNDCHYDGLPLTIHGIRGKQRITRSLGTTPTPLITTIARLCLMSRNNTSTPYI